MKSGGVGHSARQFVQQKYPFRKEYSIIFNFAEKYEIIWNTIAESSHFHIFKREGGSWEWVV